MKKDETNLFFLVMALICVWLLLDMAVGKNYVRAFLCTLFPFMRGKETITDTANIMLNSGITVGEAREDLKTEITETTGKGSIADRLINVGSVPKDNESFYADDIKQQTNNNVNKQKTNKELYVEWQKENMNGTFTGNFTAWKIARGYT